MAYEAHKWKIGEEITSEKLNHIEKGIETGGDIQTNIQNPTDGQTLKYDTASGKWVNGEGGSSTLVANATYDASTHIFTLDKTFQEIVDAYPNVIYKISNPSDQTQYKFTQFTSVEVENGYKLTAIIDPTTYEFSANSPDEYPKTQGQG